MIICSRIPNLSISILTGLVFSVHHIYITYGAPACTTCLFILNLSKNSHLCLAIVSESGCKSKRFYRNRQMFSKVFLKKFFFETSIKGGRPSSPGLIRSRSLSPAKVRYWVQTAVKENSPTFVSPSQSHCLKCRISLDCGCKGRPFNDNQQTYEGKIIRIS